MLLRHGEDEVCSTDTNRYRCSVMAQVLQETAAEKGFFGARKVLRTGNCGQIRKRLCKAKAIGGSKVHHSAWKYDVTSLTFTGFLDQLIVKPVLSCSFSQRNHWNLMTFHCQFDPLWSALSEEYPLTKPPTGGWSWGPTPLFQYQTSELDDHQGLISKPSTSQLPSPAVGRRTPPGRADGGGFELFPRTSSLRPEGWPDPPPKSLAVGESNRKPMGKMGKTMGKTMKSHGSYQGCSHYVTMIQVVFGWIEDEQIVVPIIFYSECAWYCARGCWMRWNILLQPLKWISIYFSMFKRKRKPYRVVSITPRNLWGWLWPTPEALWSAKQKWSTKNLGRTYVYLPL